MRTIVLALAAVLAGSAPGVSFTTFMPTADWTAIDWRPLLSLRCPAPAALIAQGATGLGRV